jgi:Lon protease-like protein
MVLFPHAVVPLYIFEERYRRMLEDVLQEQRMFAIFKEDPERDSEEEPPHKVGSVGVIRAAHQNPDGTTNLALQGIARVRLLEVVQETPYRTIRVASCPGSDPVQEDKELRQRILSLVDAESGLVENLPEEYLDFLRGLQEPEPFVDVAIQALCHCPEEKQRLLETLDLEERYTRFENFLLKEKRRLELYRKLQGRTREDEIDLN